MCQYMMKESSISETLSVFITNILNKKIFDDDFVYVY